MIMIMSEEVFEWSTRPLMQTLLYALTHGHKHTVAYPLQSMLSQAANLCQLMTKFDSPLLREKFCLKIHHIFDDLKIKAKPLTKIPRSN